MLALCHHSIIPQQGVKNKTSEDSLDAMFTKFAQLKKDSRRKQLSAMEQKLDDMDKELSVLVLSAEMHK